MHYVTHTFVTLVTPSPVAHHDAGRGCKIPQYLWESFVFSIPLKYFYYFFSGTIPMFDLVLNNNNKMMSVDMDLLGFCGPLVVT